MHCRFKQFRSVPTGGSTTHHDQLTCRRKTCRSPFRSCAILVRRPSFAAKTTIDCLTTKPTITDSKTTITVTVCFSTGQTASTAHRGCTLHLQFRLSAKETKKKTTTKKSDTKRRRRRRRKVTRNKATASTSARECVEILAHFHADLNKANQCSGKFLHFVAPCTSYYSEQTVFVITDGPKRRRGVACGVTLLLAEKFRHRQRD